MYALRDAQDHFAATLADGPLACPTDLFGGAPVRVLRGLKVHANTIFHARLVALEEIFPRTRSLMGEALFNELCREFLDSGNGLSEPLASIGRTLPDWFAAQQLDPAFVAEARFEWLWLESYHAAEAISAGMDDFAGQAEDHILAQSLVRHPSASHIGNAQSVAQSLGLPPDTARLLIVRPAAEVLVYALPDADAAMLDIFAIRQTLRSGIETFCAARANDDAMESLLHLIETGALTEEFF